jgi:hypothetical protein
MTLYEAFELAVQRRHSGQSEEAAGMTGQSIMVDGGMVFV